MNRLQKIFIGLGLAIASLAFFALVIESMEPCSIELCFLKADGKLACQPLPMRLGSAMKFTVPKGSTDTGMIRVTCTAWEAGLEQRAIDDGGALPL